MGNMWQVCPLCKGSGSVLSNLSSSSSGATCTVCNGKRIISTLTGLPPNYELHKELRNKKQESIVDLEKFKDLED